MHERKRLIEQPKAEEVIKPQTLIERITNGRFKISWDEAAFVQPGAKKDFDFRSMYQQIPCLYGHLYEYNPETIAWFCPSVRVSLNVLRVAEIKNWDWLEIQVETDEETIFLFPPEGFDVIAEWAYPRRRRNLNTNELNRLFETGKNTRF